MSDERAQLRLANSCNILSEVSAELPNTLPWLDSTDVDKCHNLIGNDTEDLCEFEKNTFGLGRRNNSREFRKKKQEHQIHYFYWMRLINWELIGEEIRHRLY